MNSTLMRRRSCSRLISSRICRCTVTSSAVVGSSAISSFGSQAIAIAIITRCCCPPDSSCGYASTRDFGSGMPTSVSNSITRSLTCLRDSPICNCRASAICQPTVNTGFSDDIGSWNTTEMSLPRIFRSVSNGSTSRLRPPNSTRLSGPTIAFSGSSRTIDIADTLLPEPDSPTSATVAFSGMSKLIPRTASAMRCLPRRNDTLRSRTETRLVMAISTLGRARRAAHR